MHNMGFNIIKEMSKDELIEEVLNHQRTELSQADIDQLKSYVVTIRVRGFHKRMLAEAEIDPPPGLLFFGGNSD